MRKLNRLVWADGISLESYGVPVGIRVNTSAALPYLLDRLPPEWHQTEVEAHRILLGVRLAVGEEAVSPRPGVRQYHLVYEGAARMARTLVLEEALDVFEATVQLLVAAEAPERVFVHAGVVAWKGQAILLPGKSHAGKTTLVTELLRAGATYYSDEYAVLDAEGRVHPYPRLLSVRERDPEGNVRAARYPAERYGATVGQEPLPVGLIVESEFRAGAHWRPKAISPGLGALALLANTVPARLRPQESMDFLGKVVAKAPILRGTRGEAAETAAEILRRLG